MKQKQMEKQEKQIEENEEPQEINAYKIPSFVDPKKFSHPVRAERTVKGFEMKENDFVEFNKDPKAWYTRRMKEYWFKYTKPEIVRCSFYTWNVSEADPEMKTGVAVVFWKVVPGNIRKGVRP